MENFDNQKFKLGGISGTFCAGKDTGALHLTDKGFMHVSTGDVLRAEATKLGKDHKRDTLIDISVELRRNHGGIGAIVLKAIEQWEEQQETFKSGLIISGIRVLGEAGVLKSLGGTLLFVDAPVEMRYARAKKRATEDGRTIELIGIKSLADFIESERAELEGLRGPERPNLRGIEKIANKVIQNTGTKAEYFKQLDVALGLN